MHALGRASVYQGGHLPSEALRVLAADLFSGHAEYDPVVDLLRPVNRTEPISMGVQPPAFEPRFRTIQVCPKDFPAMPRQSGGAAPATFVGGLTMSERVVDEGQSWASDIIGVLSGVGLYSVLIFLVTFLCLYVPA